MYAFKNDPVDIKFLFAKARQFARKYGYIGTLEPDDIAQLAIIRLLEKDQAVPQPSGWLHKTIGTIACDVYRHHRRERNHFARLDDPDIAGSVCERADDRGFVHVRNTYVAERDDLEPDVLPRLKDVLAQLRPALRQVLVLYSEGHTYRELATMLGVNIGTIRSRLYYARRRAQDLLGEI